MWRIFKGGNMIHCERCDRFKKVIAVEEDHLILLCGHIVQKEGNKAYCSECDTLVPVSFDGQKMIYQCGHLRTETDDKMDKLLNKIDDDFVKESRRTGKSITTLKREKREILNKLLDPQFLKEWKRKNKV